MLASLLSLLVPPLPLLYREAHLTVTVVSVNTWQGNSQKLVSLICLLFSNSSRPMAFSPCPLEVGLFLCIRRKKEKARQEGRERTREGGREGKETSSKWKSRNKREKGRGMSRAPLAFLLVSTE